MRQASEPMLFDTKTDPRQTKNVADEAPEELERFRSLLVDALETLEAPEEQYERFALDQYRW